jgi:two-component system chemotaxis response regulator CheB
VTTAAGTEEQPGPGRIIGVGASAGGVEALMDLVALLPADLQAPVVIVLHVAPAGTSVLAELLDRRSALHVVTAKEGAHLQGGHVYVAPPDHHVVVAADVMHLNREARENGHRPAIDPTFRSIASAYGDRGIGVVLSGTRDDGALGLGQIDAAGGAALVQDPDESHHEGMPRNAIRAVPRAEVATVDRLAARLVELVQGPPPPDVAPA